MRQPGPAWIAAGLLLAGTALADDISEGELRFLETRPGPAVHQQSKQLVIRPDSLGSGWIEDRQCHRQLDPVPAMQVVFGPDRVRRLRITHSAHIDRVRIEDNTVQLAGVHAGAEFCLHSELRLLEFDPLLQQYTLTSGPYLRRYFDGYFPLQLGFELEYPVQHLRLTGIQPPELAARARHLPGRIRIDALFEGRLDITLRFAPVRAD